LTEDFGAWYRGGVAVNECIIERVAMKKPKRSAEWEESTGDSSKESDALLDDLDDLDDLDEEIIDLDEIVEPFSEDALHDDEFASDTEILGGKGDLAFGDLEGKMESEEDFLLEDDLLKELPFFQEEKRVPEPPRREQEVAKEPEHPALDVLLETDRADIEEFEGLTEEALIPEEPGHAVSELPLETLLLQETEPEVPVQPIEALLPEEKQLEISATPPEPFLPLDAEVSAQTIGAPAPEEMEPEVSAPPVEASADLTVSLDDFVNQIEDRLVNTIREIVEARLPEIVRTVLREEIDRLKIDAKPED
jgi:hypothetical protein